MKSFVRFSTISGCGWLLDSSLLFLFTQWLNLPVFQANFLSSVIAAIAVFSASRLLVFGTQGGQYLLRTTLYALYTCVVILLASSAMPAVLVLVRALESHYALSLGPGTKVLLAKVVVTPPQLLANFCMARLLSTAMSAMGLEGSASASSPRVISAPASGKRSRSTERATQLAAHASSESANSPSARD